MHDASAPEHDTSMTHPTNAFSQAMTLDDTYDTFSRNQTYTRAHTPEQRPHNASYPSWLQHYMTTTGLPDPRHAGTTARPAYCPTCRRIILAGYDSPLAAILATVDPNPLTPQLEAAAVILAIPTYQLWGDVGRYELTQRYHPAVPHTIRRRPASDVTVLATHRCDYHPLSHAHIPTRNAHTAPDPTGPAPF